jgi:uncharacterized peroxidase-related enzyme
MNMSRIDNPTAAQLDANQQALSLAEAAMGFVPNSLKITARNTELLNGFLMLSNADLGPSSTLNSALRQMIANITSAAAGCLYYQAHTAHGAERHGVDAAKIKAIWPFQTSDLFCYADHAVLDLAQAAGSVPNNATDQQFENLKQYYSEDEIVDIVAVIAYFGFLNRWNDTLATPLEESPLAFAESHLTANGWQLGKHGTGREIN